MFCDDSLSLSFRVLSEPVVLKEKRLCYGEASSNASVMFRAWALDRWGQILALSLTDCATSGRLLSLPLPQCLFCIIAWG